MVGDGDPVLWDAYAEVVYEVERGTRPACARHGLGPAAFVLTRLVSRVFGSCETVQQD